MQTPLKGLVNLMQLIATRLGVLVNNMLGSWSDTPDAFSADVRNEYIAKFSALGTIHAICDVLWSDTQAVATWNQPHGISSNSSSDVP